jgi:hypothetical protein
VAGPTTTASGQLALAVETSDADAGIARLIAGVPGGEGVDVAGDELVGDRATVIVTLPAQDGATSVEVAAVDAAGNRRTSVVPIVVDRTLPRPSIQVHALGTTRAVVLLQANEPVRLRVDLWSQGVARPVDTHEGLATLHVLDLDGLAPGAPYRVGATVADAAGNERRVGLDLATAPDLAPPGPVSALVLERTPDGAVVLSWPPAMDDAGIARYDVFRRADSATPALVATVREPFHVDVGVPPGLHVAYHVVPVDHAENRGPASPERDIRGRTAPQVVSLVATPDGDRVVVIARVLDEDGDEPRVDLVIGGVRHPMEVSREHDQLVVARGTFDAPRAVLGGPGRHFHVEVTDGLFSARAPAVGEELVPAGIGQPSLVARATLGMGGGLAALAGIGALLLLRRWRGSA